MPVAERVVENVRGVGRRVHQTVSGSQSEDDDGRRFTVVADTTASAALAHAAAARKAAGTAAGAAAAELNARLIPKPSDLVMCKETAKKKLLEKTGGVRQTIMTTLKHVIQEQAVSDPDMWPCIRAGIRSGIDSFWSDLEIEVERKLEEAVLLQAKNKEAKISGYCGCTMAIRACFLHNILPHDKSIFGSLKNPVFLVMCTLGACPVYAIRVVFFLFFLFFLVCPGPPDEYQLIHFILALKGSQFITAGVANAVIAGLSYFYCASWETKELAECIRDKGPGTVGSVYFDLADYLGSVVLVWIAFLALPGSVNSARRHFVIDGARRPSSASEEEDTDEPRDCCCSCCGYFCRCCRCATRDASRAWRLRNLLCYDMCCFLVSMALLVATQYSLDGFQGGGGINQGNFVRRGEDPQVQASVCWCKTLYSLLTFPFAIFLVPVVSTVLTHSDRTGFNKHGACVAWALPATGKRRGDERDNEADSDSEVGFSTSTASSSVP